MRRGIKEMDIILSRFAEMHLDDLGEAELEDYDALLSENDQDLYSWITGRAVPPGRFAQLIGRISGFCGAAD